MAISIPKIKTDISVKIGLKIKQLREQQDLSQEQLANKAGLYRTYIGQIERAEKNISIFGLEKITI